MMRPSSPEARESPNRSAERPFPKNFRNSACNVILITLISIVFLAPYETGYRLSRDDVWFLMVGMDGLQSVYGHAISIAVDQGRIGQLIMLPLNVAGAVLSGSPVWRVVFLVLYFTQFLLFSILVARLLKSHVAPFLLTLLVSLHPLAFDLMPPNAYPLQNTVPYILVILARLVILQQRERNHPSRPIIFCAQLMFALGMFVSEFVVALGTALLAAEYLARMREHWPPKTTWAAFITAVAPKRFIISDAVSTLTALVPYVVFRWWNPSQYEGNSADGIFKVARVLKTAWQHILAGTPARFLNETLAAPSAAQLLVAICLGLAVAFVLYRLWDRVAGICSPLAAAAIAFGLAFYVSLPIAISPKYQIQCIDWTMCGYLDSRASYLFVCVALMCLMGAIIRHGPRPLVPGLSCAIIGGVATLVSLHNFGKAREMMEFHAIWERGEAVACTNPDLIKNEDAFIAFVDPKGLISMHPPSKPIEFWRIYIPRRHAQGCTP